MRVIFLMLIQMIWIAIPIGVDAQQKDPVSIIVEVEGDPNTYVSYFETHHPFIEIVAVYDKLFNGIALQGDPDKIAKAANQDFIHVVHPVQTYKTTAKIGSPKMEWKEKDGESVVVPGASHTSTYTGKGVKVGVIDTGIDYSHPDLASNYVGGYDLVDLDNDPMETLPSEGIPTIHGTHVAGIIAGGGQLKGVAPDAQLFAYRALGPGGTGSSIQVIAALEQAVEDGVDIINLSLGNTVNGPDYPTSKAVNRATELGVAVVTANGNDGPNNWTVGSPATASKAIAVGAATHTQKIPMLYDSFHKKHIQLTSPPLSSPWNLTKDYSIVHAQDQENMAGKIVLLHLFDSSVYENVKRAASQGAVGVIIYSEEDILQEVTPNEQDPISIPVAFISNADAKWIKNRIEEKELYVDTVYEMKKTTTASFSSRGPVTVNWQIKPDILAPGTSILSSVPGGYRALNGTSMAAPHVAGAIAVMKEAKPNWTNQQIINALKTTAQPIMEGGIPLEPISQGMGTLNIDQALQTETIITDALLTFGKLNDYKEMKKTSITIENLSNQEQTFRFHIPKKAKGLSWKLPQTFTVESGKKKNIPIELAMTTMLMEEGIKQGFLSLENKRTKQMYQLPYVFINQTANYPKAAGFQFALKPFSDDTYTYQLYMTERAKKVDIHLYNAETLLYEQKLLTLKTVNEGINEGELESLQLKDGRYKVVLTIELESGEFASHQSQLVVESN